MSRAATIAATLGLCSTLFSSCKDADTVIAVWAPENADHMDAAVSAAGGEPNVMDASADDADTPHDAEPDAEAPKPNAFYVEAEAFELSGAFGVGESEQAHNGQFISASEDAATEDMPGTGLALHELYLLEAGDYVIWGRIHAPTAESNRFWVKVDEGAWFLWRISTGDAWFWDDLHDDKEYGVPLTFALAAGAHELAIASAVMGAELDRLYVTALNDHPPGNSTPCNPPHSIEVAGVCVRSCGSHGEVSCEVDVCAKPELDVYDCAVCCLL